MSDFPAAATFDNIEMTAEQHITAMEAFLAATKQLPGGEAISDLNIATGVITPTGGIHRVDTESGVSADDLVTIQYTNIRDGALLYLTLVNSTHAVTVKHLQGGDGQISLVDGDCIMDFDGACILLQRRGTVWYELLRNYRPLTHTQTFITSSQTYTVPAGVRTLYVTAYGGGGGGGGGASSEAVGNTGSDGGDTVFGTHFTVTGGKGGGGGYITGLGGGCFAGGVNGQNGYGSIGGPGATALMTLLGNRARGGNGGDGVDGAGGGASGSHGMPEIRKPLAVTPGEQISITIGAGGLLGAGGTGTNPGGDGTAGQSGAVLIEY